MLVYNENGALKVNYNGKIDVYQLSSISSISPFIVHNFNGSVSHCVLVKFSESEYAPLKLRLVDITNQATWLDSFSGAGVAIADLSSWQSLAVSGLTAQVTDFVTVSGADVNNWDASVGFISDAIEFGANEAWSIQISDYAIVGGTPTITILVSDDGVNYAEYDAQSTLIDITSTANRYIRESSFSGGFMKIQYVANAATGTFDMTIRK